MRKLPIKMALDVVKAYDLEQVVILCKDKEGTQHIVTAGNTKASCKDAGLSGDMLKQVLAWPEETLSKYTKQIRDSKVKKTK